MNIKKSILTRSLLGAPLGVVINYGIAICISLSIGDGSFYAVSPQLAADWGSELNAVLIQTGCSLLYGAVWGGASVIWEIEEWSLLRMTVTHLLLCSAATFPAAYFTRWMARSLGGILSYFSIFLIVYLCIWLFQFGNIKRRIQRINKELQKKP